MRMNAVEKPNRRRPVHLVERSLDPHFYIYRVLDDLAGRRLPNADVFVPEWVEDPSWFDMERVGFYFTVPGEHWSAVLVRGTADGVDVVEAMEVDIAEHAADPEYDRRTLARERLQVRTMRKHGLVTPEELYAQRACLLDGTFAERRQVGKYRVFRSNRVEVEAFADMLASEADWLIVPVLPAFSWKQDPVEFPVNDPRYAAPMVHAVTRTPCPWQPVQQERCVFV
ncbi:hypothetical protein HT749_06675 [Burkholderia cepacia]|uniref:hypothetical protein n=1 Tax=Burkholderia cepacia TaxID=292 RepID=UPI00157B54B7|nr:hypothetical protein [Burkholderia cepacia]NTX43081.1 hypothetical protein [Burkholderia cepacia]